MLDIFVNQLDHYHVLLQLKVRFTQKMLMKWSKCHSCEPFFAPELGGKFKLINGTDKMLILSFFCISKINPERIKGSGLE